MFIIYWILFGGFAGWVASIITKQNNQMGIIQNVLVGFLGSIIGGFIANQFLSISYRTFSITGFIVAVGGAVVLLTVINSTKRKR